MADRSLIEFTDATWNPVSGCTKVSSGCKHCYAERQWRRFSSMKDTVYYQRPFTDVRCHEEKLQLPLHWRKPRRIFVNAMADLFHPDVPDGFIDQVFAVMARCPQHTFQILTKRPERMRAYLTVRDTCLLNLWLGVSVEDQQAADERIPSLLYTPAVIRWISVEPMLGLINLCRTTDGMPWIGSAFADGRKFDGLLDWVVAGGETGPQARPIHPQWIRALRDQCLAARVPFLFKQYGEWIPAALADEVKVETLARRFAWLNLEGRLHDGTDGVDIFGSDEQVCRVGKRHAGRRLDGLVYDDYPEVSHVLA